MKILKTAECKRLLKCSEEKSGLFESDRKLFHSQSECIISWHFLFIHVEDKQIFFAFIE